ncbi:MAG: SAM-dependent methyltransferase [Acidobacteriia bacterium]|nr:SAM-dependent methyltransferase [Terriglobia bacterium]
MSRRSTAIRKDPASAEPVVIEPAITPAGSRYLIPWLLLFAASGCAALIYEIVWFQMLQLVIGSSAISLGLLLAAYMGGLGLGSALLPRLVSLKHHPMRVYALLELGIGAFGMIALFAVPLIGRIYFSSAISGVAGLVLRGVIAALCLLPPTLLMGGSLPAMARWAETTPIGVSRLGLLYSANIAGAVLGCLLAGFYLLRVYDLAVATYSAAAINLAVALGALAIAARSQKWRAREPEEQEPVRRSPGAPLIYVVVAISGLSALGAEVVWTRLLSLLLGATVYTFSIILAVFLSGLWVGSSVGSFLVRKVSNPRVTLAACQLLLALAIAWTAFHLAFLLPYWPVDPWLSLSPWFNFDLDLTRCLRAIFPATLFWGASFPLALASAAAPGEDPARLSGQVYAANTAGSIVGALAFSLLLIPALGTRGSQQLLVWLAAAGALAALAAAGLVPGRRIPAVKFGSAVAALLVIALGLSAGVGEVPWQMIAYGRRIAPILRGLNNATDAQTEPLFVGEGINSSVVISQRADQRFFYVSGKSEASSSPLDMRLQRMMGHLPALFHTAPHNVLVVGFGAGVTAGSFVPYPEVRAITICELERMIPPASDQYFGKENYHVLRDRRTRLIYDDARHFVSTTPEKFDVITTDPIHPWVKGTSTLYSKEYYESVRLHLNPGGVAAQWLPIYESDEETVKTELATFFDVFPNATVWSNYSKGDGYDLVLIGRPDSGPINIDEMQARLDRSAYAAVAASLADAGFHSAVDVAASYAGSALDLAPMVVGVEVNNDLNLRLQYLAGMGLNSTVAPRIYSEILQYRKSPEAFLTGSGDRINELRTLLGRPHRTF